MADDPKTQLAKLTEIFKKLATPPSPSPVPPSTSTSQQTGSKP